MTNRRAFLLAALASAAPLPALAEARFSPERLARVRAVAKACVDEGFAPGAVVQINTGSRDLLREAIGFADRERQAPMRVDSLFRIYSMTKPLTTAMAMRLVDDGRLSLEDPVAKFIPEFAEAKVYAGGQTLQDLTLSPLQRPVTIRDLMRHSAGLTYTGDGSPVARLYALRGVPTGSGGDKPPLDGSPAVRDLAEFARLIARQPLTAQPGETFTYGGSVDVLGRVIEVIERARLHEVMAARLFTPLRMVDSRFEVREVDKPRLTAAYVPTQPAKSGSGVLDVKARPAPPLALIDDPQKTVFANRPIDFGGAGAISTAGDYIRFLRMIAGGGALDGVRVLRPQSVAAMTRNQLGASALATPGLAAHGLGFGLGFATLVAPEKAPVAAPSTLCFWSGAASTHFFVDPKSGACGVLMTQVFADDVRRFQLRVLDALYAKT